MTSSALQRTAALWVDPMLPKRRAGGMAAILKSVSDESDAAQQKEATCTA